MITATGVVHDKGKKWNVLLDNKYTAKFLMIYFRDLGSRRSSLHIPLPVLETITIKFSITELISS